MSEHTPLPWTYFEQKRWGQDGTYGCVRSPAVEGYPDGFVIINGCAPGGTDEQKANAKFIARACNSHDELLAACRDLVHAQDCGMGVRPVALRIELARTAIAKAEA